MIVAITPKFKFVCDRCGKEIFSDEYGYIEPGRIYSIAVAACDYFSDSLPKEKIEVCRECCEDFEEFMKNFRDAVNKEDGS
jgi:hypothetical protein